MTLERQTKQRTTKSQTRVKSKYRLAQRYLINHPLEPKALRPHLRYFYIALVQSLAAEGELGIPRSPATLAGLDQFFRTFQHEVRFKILQHAKSLIAYDLIQIIQRTQAVRQLTPEEREIYTTLKHIEESGDFDKHILANWDRFHTYFGEEFLQIVDNRTAYITVQYSDPWFETERKINAYRHEGKGNPVILFEQMRYLAHQGGIILKDMLDVYGLVSEPLFEREVTINMMLKWEKDHPNDPLLEYAPAGDIFWQIFMDILSKDAFQFELPYRFGINGKKEDSN
jgi:hypothetical protein